MKTTFCESYQLEDFLSDGGFAMFDKIYKQYNLACQMEKDDCYQEYTIAAARAIREYNTDRVDVKLFTFVWDCVENAAKMICRRGMAKKRESNLHPVAMSRIERYFEDERAGTWHYPELKSYERLCADNTFAQVLENDGVEYIYRIIANAGLTPLEHETIMLSIQGLSQAEIGRRVSRAQSQVSKYKKEATRKLRIHMEVMV